MVGNLPFQIRLQVLYFLPALTITTSTGAVAPPAWANPKYNPCALQPGGWQMLYWPPDGRCYRIFQVGYPCPEGMELTPTTIPSATGEKQVAAECQCPPQTAQFAHDGKCYRLFGIGPCDKGQYFAPDTQYIPSSHSKRRWGICKQNQNCLDKNEIYWPQDGRCYLYLTQGPCPKGQLITSDLDKIAVCKCNYRYEMNKYYSTGNGCFEHFTRGPCRENGHLFLPDRSCGCNELLPHYHNQTKHCYEIGSIGPCNSGEQFRLDINEQTATCQCKLGHIRYKTDLNCYRPYTKGPCQSSFILVNSTTCIKQPCERGYLFYPATSVCYRIGTQGPCQNGYVITFDFTTRPSVDGISYNGICHCKSSNHQTSCFKEKMSCSSDHSVVLYNNKCFKLYSQGPCCNGAWLTIQQQNKSEEPTQNGSQQGACECMPGYKEKVQSDSNKNITQCISPTVVLAELLNNKNYYTMMEYN